MLYPLSYGGSAAAHTGPRANGTEQPYQPAPPTQDHVTATPIPPGRHLSPDQTSRSPDQTSRNRDNRQDTPGNCAHERPNSG
jgi:hypothetical protein